MMNFASFVILATAIASASAQVMVNTPTSVVACLPVQITWTGGQGPYFVSLLPGGKAGATPLEDLGQQAGNTYVWKVDQPAGTSITIQIRDSQGQLNYSDQFTVQPGTTTCATASGSGATATTSSTPATTTGTAAANTSASKSPTTSTTTTSTTNSTSSTPKSTTGAATTGSTTGSTTGTGTTGTSTNGTSASTDARSDASRTSAGVLAVAVACVVAVFA